MPTQPARPQQTPQERAKAANDQKMKQWVIIGFGSVAVFVTGFFFLNALMEEDRGGRSLVNEVVESKPTKKFVVDDTPVAMLPRPILLYEEYVKAIMNDQKAVVKRYSEFDESKLDLLMTEERRKIITDALMSKRWKYSEKPEKFEGQTARLSAIYSNNRGFDMMELALVMRQKGGPDDWVVTSVEDRWFAPSGQDARVEDGRARRRPQGCRGAAQGPLDVQQAAGDRAQEARLAARNPRGGQGQDLRAHPRPLRREAPGQALHGLLRRSPPSASRRSRCSSTSSWA